LSNVGSIGSKSFSEVPLKTVNVPSSVQSVSNDAFEGSLDLESISLPQYTSFNFRNLNKIKNATFGSISLLKEGFLNFSQTGVTSLEDFLFTNSSILEVFLPSSINSLGTQLFAYCKNLRRVTIASSLSEISFGLFQETPLLTYISIGGRILYENSVLDFSTSSITKVNDLAFSGIGAVSRVVFGAQDITFDAYALSSNSYLTYVEYRDVPFVFQSQYLFWDCPNLKNLVYTGPYDCTFYAPLDFHSIFRRSPLEALNDWCFVTLFKELNYEASNNKHELIKETIKNYVVVGIGVLVSFVIFCVVLVVGIWIYKKKKLLNVQSEITSSLINSK
jgi:hypothetical protein